MCKEFNINNIPEWIVSAMNTLSGAGVYQMTEMFLLYNEEKTMEKYYELLCRGLIEKNKTLQELLLKEKMNAIHPQGLIVQENKQ